ncbi:MAG: hypothetical protein IT179_09625 [Acidobacteria bacterium]|nr:hypothetical protein [Acidobacteriota bacterium]
MTRFSRVFLAGGRNAAPIWQQRCREAIERVPEHTGRKQAARVARHEEVVARA